MKAILPKPPSVNMLYGYNRHTGAKYIKPEGEAWFKQAGYMVKSQIRTRKPITTDCELYVKINYCGRYDIDNGLKALLDLIAKRQQIIEDDSLITYLTINKERVKHRKDESVEIELRVL